MKLFWTLWGIDAITAFTCICFFIGGLTDSSVSERNIGQWALMLLVPLGLLAGGWFLKSAEHLILAKILLALLAIPAILFVLFYLILILTGAKWQ
jgi:hypothetical protein